MNGLGDISPMLLRRLFRCVVAAQTNYYAAGKAVLAQFNVLVWTL